MSDGLDCLLWDDLSRRVTAAVGLLATATLHLGARKPVSDDPCPSANLYGGSISLIPTLEAASASRPGGGVSPSAMGWGDWALIVRAQQAAP